MIDGIISYIRSWFPVSHREEITRKRRAPDTFHHYTSPKFRKVLSPVTNNIEDDLFSSSLNYPSRRSFTRISRPFFIEDDDDVVITRPMDIKRTGRVKDTKPAASENKPKLMLNGDDDIIFVKSEKLKPTASKQADSKKPGFAYITRFTPTGEAVTSRTGGMQNGTRPKISPIPKTPRDPKTVMNTKSSMIRSPSLDYSIRLDDKRKYKELLESAALHGSFNNSSIYSTPVGKFYNYDVAKRTKKIMELAKSPKQKVVEVVDLTNESKQRLSTKDAVKKALDDYESETAVIEDSDSDVEILPTPPSPKPDIKVDPINSLKTVIDTSKATHKEWLTDVSEKYQRYVEGKEKEVKAYTENSSTLNEINRDLLIKSLTKKIHDSLAIKETILPEEEEEEEIELPALSDEQLRMVKKAFSGDPSEVLTRKFNLNFSRRDVQTLAGLNWLNDNVINFYMNLIIERGRDPKWPKAYAMNSFFYQKLCNNGPEALRRWTKKVDIFAHEFVCVPIHLGMHWCMAIVYLKERAIRYYDSMGSDNNQCLNALKNYLEYEHQDKKGSAYSTKDFVLENVRDIPQQMNGSDCGMFACTFAEFATRRAKFTFSQQDMPYLRKKMIVEILTGELLIQ